MRRIIENSRSHPLKRHKIHQFNKLSCDTHTRGKLIRPSPIQSADLITYIFIMNSCDIYGPIIPPSEPFKYFVVLIDASSRWSHTCFLSS